MTTCMTPPEGWCCSREAGHEGPCAASLSEPITRIVNYQNGRLIFCPNSIWFEFPQKKENWYNKLWKKIRSLL